MTAETIAKALGGRKVGTGWLAPCPGHADHRPSLSVRDADDGKVLVKCHANCDQRDVIAALKESGLWHGRVRLHLRGASRRRMQPPQLNHQQPERTAAALSVWQSSVSANGTPVENYLAGRGLFLTLPPSLRFHRGLKHPSGGFWPCMVALVTQGGDGSPLAIHRTFLAHDGSGKALIDPAKMMFGPCRGGAVRLGEPGEVLLVGEGIETCLAATQETGYPVWAALSTSGLRRLELPEGLTDVIVLADGDKPGEAAARDCASRWKREGRRVRIARPPRGQDFNDLLLCGRPASGDGGA